MPSAELRLALAGHGVGFVRVGGGGRRAGDAQQAAGNVAGEDRHGGGGDDRRDRGDRRQIEGDGTRSAVAMVADRPGSEPTTRP